MLEARQRLTMLEAKAAGVRRYFTGLECPQGHIAERFVSTRACVQCMAMKSTQWKAANPEKHAAQHRAWALANPERAKELKLSEQSRNRDGANRRNRRYRLANQEQVRLATATWQAANPGAVNARAARRRAALIQRTPAWANLDAIAGMYELAAAFRRTGLQVEVDHDFPLQGRTVSGLHVADNLQFINAIANKVKSNSFAGTS
jgi:hypothetical protein